jgi:hypothetical protein
MIENGDLIELMAAPAALGAVILAVSFLEERDMILAGLFLVTIIVPFIVMVGLR